MRVWIYVCNKPISIVSITTLAFMSFNFGWVNGEVINASEIAIFKADTLKDLRRWRNNEKFTGSEVSLKKLLLGGYGLAEFSFLTLLVQQF